MCTSKNHSDFQKIVALQKKWDCPKNGADVLKIITAYERIVCKTRIFYVLLKIWCAVPKNCAGTENIVRLEKICADVKKIFCSCQKSEPGQ
jgi:hypothetical protein